MLIDIGGVLKKAISDHNMTQKEVANLIHISPQALNSYVNNRRIPDLECFFALIDLLDLNEIFFSKKTYDKKKLDMYLLSTIPTLTLEQKRMLLYLLEYLNSVNHKKEPFY